MGELSFLVCAESDIRADEISRYLEASGHARVEARLVDVCSLPKETRRLRPDAIFVSLAEGPEQALDILAQLGAPRPLLLLSGPHEDSGLLLRAMRLGTKEFFGPDLDEGLVHEAVSRLLLDLSPPEGHDARPAHILSVIGAKGGIGATSIACQLAAALQQHGSAGVVDLDVEAGDVAHYLDVTPSYTLANLKAGSAGLDSTYLRMLLQAHPSGLHILAAPERLEDIELATQIDLDTVCRLLKDELEWVVLDLARSWTESTLRALDLSDQILLITGFDVPVLRHTQRKLELFQRLGYGRKVRLVFNRQSTKDPIGERDVERFLKQAPDACLPNEFETATASIDRGQPVGQVGAEKPLDRAYRDLAVRVHEWCGIPVRASRPSPSWVRRLLGRVR